MSRFEGPQGIVTNGLVLNLDAGDPDSYTRSQPPYVEVLVVAGGGSGGTSTPSNGGGAGGGAGGVIYNSAYQLTNASAVTVTVGAGGAGQTSDTTQGNDGSNSVFGSLTAVGGGGGGSASGGNTTGRNGGSGGGAGYVGYYNNFNSGTGTAGQGFRGGYVLANNNAGGGGGAGGVGGDTFDSRPEPGYAGGNGGTGGPGVTYSISGTSTLYSNGGNGGSNSANTIVNGSGTTGTYGDSSDSSTAGSGIIIVRYPGLPAATGGTITYLNGYTIHTFTTSGTFTPYPWNDISGNNNSGSLVNGIGFNSYENGGFLTFDGSDDFVTIAGGTLNNGSTLEMWFKQTTNKQVELLKYGTGNIDTPGCHAVYYTPNTLRCLNFINGTRTFVSLTHTINLGDSTWRQLLLSYTGNLTGGTASLYINGQLITSTSATSTNSSFDGPGFSSNSSYAFPGNLSTLRVYSRGLSAAEVLQNYNAQKS